MKRGQKNHPCRHGAGFSLLESLVAVAIMGAITAQVNYTMTSQMKSTKKVENQVDIEIIRAFLLEKIDCTQTVLPASCNGQAVTLMGRPRPNGTPTRLLTTTATPGGGFIFSDNWGIRATCQSNGPGDRGIEIAVGQFLNGQAVQDPVSNEIDYGYDTYPDNPIISRVERLCNQPASAPASDCTEIGPAVSVLKDTANNRFAATCIKVDNAYVENSSINSQHYVNGAVTSAKIQQEQVYQADLARLSVTDGKFADNAVSTSNLVNFSVRTGHIQDNEIGTAHFPLNAVQNPDLASDLADASNLAAGIITTRNIRDYAVSRTKIRDDAVTTEKVSDGTITGSFVQDATITRDQIDLNSLTGTNLVAGTLRSNTIDTRAVFGEHIRSNAIVNDDLADNSIAAWNMADGILTNAHFNDASILFENLAPCPADGQVWRYNANLSPPGWECSTPNDQFELSTAALLLKGNAANVNDYSLQLITGANAGWAHHRRVNTMGGAGGFEDGIGCDPRQGWQMLYCSMGDNEALNETNIAETVLGNNHYLAFDRDFRVDANPLMPATAVPALGNQRANQAASVCWTNDWWNATETTWGVAGGPPRRKADLQISITATCIRVKP